MSFYENLSFPGKPPEERLHSQERRLREKAPVSDLNLCVTNLAGGCRVGVKPADFSVKLFHQSPLSSY